MFEAVGNVFRNYANFKGRARRSEYWFFYLFTILVSALIYGVWVLVVVNGQDPITATQIMSACTSLFALGTFIPSLAVACRRLHDTGKSGSYILFSFIPVVGSILILVWMLEDGEPCANRYGPDPKGRKMIHQIDRKPLPPVEPVDQPVVKDTPKPTPPVHNPVGIQINCVCEKGLIRGTSVKGKRILIGRDKNQCMMAFPEGAPGVSKKHCVVYVDGNDIYITDLGSSYGTYLANGQRIPANQPVKINSGDLICLATDQTVISVSRS